MITEIRNRLQRLITVISNKISGIPEKGFTLLELLLAVSIFSIVASVIYSSFRLGIVSWKRTETNLLKYQKTRYVLDSITTDLTNAYFSTLVPFTGEQDLVEFCGSFLDPKTKKITIGKISYSYAQPEDGGLGAIVRKKLPFWIVSQQKLYEEQQKDNDSLIQIEEPELEILLDNVIDFKLSYCYAASEEDNQTLEWLGDWSSDEEIPIGIKVEIKIKDDNSDEATTSFSKRMYIPSGVLISQQEINKHNEPI